MLFQIIVLDYSADTQEMEEHVVQIDRCTICNVESLSPLAMPSLSGKTGRAYKLRGCIDSSWFCSVVSCNLLAGTSDASAPHMGSILVSHLPYPVVGRLKENSYVLEYITTGKKRKKR